MTLTVAAANRIARAAAARRQRAEAKKLAMLAVRGAYDPPRWVLDRLSPGDRIEYEAARDEARKGKT